jgi:hypothetical protein
MQPWFAIQKGTAVLHYGRDRTANATVIERDLPIQSRSLLFQLVTCILIPDSRPTSLVPVESSVRALHRATFIARDGG